MNLYFIDGLWIGAVLMLFTLGILSWKYKNKIKGKHMITVPTVSMIFGIMFKLIGLYLF